MKKAIIFFDGICGLCNTSVDFILRKDKKGEFLYSPLQGETAKKLLPPPFRDDLETIVLYQDEQILTRSEAVFKIAAKLPYPWRIFSFFSMIPRFISNFFYRAAARYRYAFFGKKESCRLPSPEERSRFLD